MVATKSASLELSESWLRVTVLGIALIIGAFLALQGGTSLLEESMRNVRDGFRTAPASGEIIVAEIDARSLRTFQSWPWPRSLHAQLLDRLDAAAVTNVTFDVDFSSPSNTKDDNRMASALAAFGGTVVLPTFQQASATDSNEKLENLPVKAFQGKAFLGSVNVLPDPDGMMRHYSYGVVTGNVPRPSLAALMAAKPGRVGSEFRIDDAIDPLTIPRVSVADVINGKIARGELAGKTVLVGATAIEMGDRYATPRHGVIPGVFIQALGAETLLQDRINVPLGPWPAIALFLLMSLIIMKSKTSTYRSGILAATAIAIFALAFVLEANFLGSPEIVPALAACLAFGAGIILDGVNARIRQSQIIDAQTGLMNSRALETVLARDRAAGVIVLSFRNFQETVSVLDSTGQAQLLDGLLERLQLASFGSAAHALQPGVFAWSTHGSASLTETLGQVEALGALFVSPVRLGSRAILLTPAFGIAERQALSSARVLSAAALRAKGALENGQRWSVHSEAAANASDRAIQLLADLETALADGQVWLAYQPKWAIDEQRLFGAEALIRWRHPLLGPIAPDELIPLLEKEGRMSQLTEMVLDQAIADMKTWASDGHDLGVAINISAPLLCDEPFVQMMLARVQDAKLPSGYLTLEVTESAAITNSEQVVKALEALQGVGARVSIDDYGTGQSTLTYLKSFPANEIKIDKSFISRMVDSPGDQVLVRSTIAMAHDLGFKVVAEGVEDAACLAKLVEFGCDVAQGWHIGKPVPKAEFIARIEEALVSSRQAA